ncbi:hypothetical protein HPB48_019126 [Haemaphysalis longicornis]|uniref:Uncharacterized protein n=1 Tax=Haemaphysalis longicornis TaxID=44386 RepID=A0A9J6GTZ0_HAELO|nr:hypothetical protein HPB48_019126 [Haemaphysalis longicornis]
MYKSLSNKSAKDHKTARNNAFCEYFNDTSKMQKTESLFKVIPNFNAFIKVNQDGKQRTGSLLANYFNEYFGNLVKGGTSSNALNNFELMSDEAFFVCTAADNEVNYIFRS